MTRFDFAGLEEALGDPGYAFPEEATDGIFDRLLQILTESRENGQLTDRSDLAALLRHVLRRQALQGSGDAHLRVPLSPDWPSAAEWARFGIQLHSEVAGFGLIHATPYEPEWLPGSDVPLFEDAFAETMVREDWQRPIDPFLEQVSGFTHYVSPGQREAVRSALLLPPGETLIVGLPTGSGKSFVAQAPVLARGLQAGLTLCVIPTTALVIDQARQMAELLRRKFPGQPLPELAWHSGLAANKRETIKAAIRSGRQSVLYCSPEAVVGPLLPALYDAARANLLGYLVVDEAHLVSQWGDGFRPAFQMLAGVRRGLLAACPTTPFRTILMSATLASDTIETIDALYGPAETVEMVASIYLRPEPQYWMHREDDPARKEAKVLEALRHAPRPFILYVTKRADARKWARLLEQHKFGRIACFHGETPHAERVSIIDRWAKNRIDGVVATSAFGVGIDKRDVRTVIHASVPETLDRFYQEVGRGGRDGRSSASLLIYADADFEVANNIAAPSLISDDLAFERWAAMFDAGEKQDEFGFVHEIDLSTVPPRLRQESDYNEAWNMRTLIMMARAKILELQSQSPARYAELEAAAGGTFDVSAEESWADYFKHTVVRLHLAGHRQKDLFVAAIQAERSRAFEASRKGHDLLRRLLSGKEEVSLLLDALYRSHSPSRTIVVSRACGGCPVDRIQGNSRQSYAEPAAIGIEGQWAFDPSLWRARFPHLNLACPILLLTGARHVERQTYAILEALVSTFGIREIGLSDRYRQAEPRIATLHRQSPDGLVLLQSLNEERFRPSHYQLPRLTVAEGDVLGRSILELRRPVHVILVGRDTRDPDHPLRRVGETGTNILTLDQFQRGARA